MIVLALLTAFPRPGGKLAAARALTLLAVLAVLITPALLIGGSRYLHGIDITTLERAPGTDAPVTVLVHFWSWTGVIVVAAVCGAVIGWVSRAGRVQAWRLTAAGRGGAARAGSSRPACTPPPRSTSTGPWAPGSRPSPRATRWTGSSRPRPRGPTRTVTRAACVVALCFPVTLGAAQSWVFATSWPSSAAFVAILRPLADGSSGRLLVEDPSLAEYYLPSGSQWQRWSSTRNIVLPSGAPTGGPSAKAGVVGDGNAGTYAMYIAQGYFSLVALNFTDTKPLDQSIAADLRRNPGITSSTSSPTARPRVPT